VFLLAGKRVTSFAMNKNTQLTNQAEIVVDALGRVNGNQRNQAARRVLSVLIPLVLASCATMPPADDTTKPADAAQATSANGTVTATAAPTVSASELATNAASATNAPPVAVKPAPSAPPTMPPPASSSASKPTAPATPPSVAATTPPKEGVVAADGTRIYPGTGKFVNQTPRAPDVPKQGEESFTINFEALDIRAVVQSILGEMLRESFTIHPQTSGTATVRYSRPIPKSELIPILETLLRQNNQIMVREEGVYKIMPQALGVRGSASPKLSTTIANLPPGFSVQLVPLKFAGVRDMARLLEPYAVEPMSSVRVDELRNMMILSGTQRELKHMLEVIDLFDVDYLAGFSVGLFPMQTDVKALTADLDRIFGGASGATGGAAGGAAAGGSPLAGIVRIIPVERLNGLLVITTQPKYLEEAKKWIDRLDKGGGLASGMRLNVYQVQHGRADRLAQLLSDVYGSGGRSGSSTSPTLAPGARPATTTTPGQPGQPGGMGGTGGAGGQGGAFGAFISNLFQSSGSAVSKDVRIIPDDDNNSLLILGSPADYETIKFALKQLDVPRRQVLVEVLVAEVTLNDELKFGVEWFINNAARNTDLSGALRTGGALPATPTSPVTALSNGLQLINFTPAGSIRALLQTLGSDGRATLEFAPKILVLDNQKATINVGDRISVQTGQTSGGNTGGGTVSSFQYLDTGVILTVTPRINSGGRVTLDITQEVSSIVPDTATTANPNPNISTRKATTVVSVASGETLPLAGLIRKQRNFGTLGVPLLSKIPLLGGLFGTQTFSTRRTELVVLITPQVVATNEESRAVTEELRDKLPALKSYIPLAKDNGKRVESAAPAIDEK
jgi:general secretion pathway protein D